MCTCPVLQAIFKLTEPVHTSLADVATPEKCTDKIFLQIDKNTDGKISLLEFIEGARANPAIQGLLQCEPLRQSGRKKLIEM